MSTQNETSLFILEQIPGSRLVKRPKKLGPDAEGFMRWTGRIADVQGQVLTVRVLDTDPRTISIQPYLGYTPAQGDQAAPDEIGDAAEADETDEADEDSADLASPGAV